MKVEALFSLLLPCSAFVAPAPCSHDEFAGLLSGGTLCQNQAVSDVPAKVRALEHTHT